MELAPKKSLTDILKDDLSICIKLQISLEIIEGVEKLHNSKIIYRDLKPDNILVFSLDESDTIHVKLTDFGIARWAPPFGLRSSEGTPGYRAPEIINNAPYSYAVKKKKTKYENINIFSNIFVIKQSLQKF